MKDITLSKFFNERIQKNSFLFTKEELKYISSHRKCVEKIYLLGLIDSKECYEDDG